MDINDVKKELGLSQNDIAEFFGYKDGGSYARSTRKHYVDNGIIEIYLRTKKAVEKNIKTVDLKKTTDEVAKSLPLIEGKTKSNVKNNTQIGRLAPPPPPIKR